MSDNGIIRTDEDELTAIHLRNRLEDGNFLRNPNYPKGKNTPDPPQPKDEFVLKFVKP